MQDNITTRIEDIANGSLAEIIEREKVIVEGYKFDNEVLNQIVSVLQKDGHSDAHILGFVLALDGRIQAGGVTDENIEDILISMLLNKSK